MTWNLQWRERTDWRSREPALLATLDIVRPDVAGLQEVWATGDTTLADQLADPPRPAPSPPS